MKIYSQLSPGTLLGGRYEIRSQIGQGRYGAVYRAFQYDLNRDVALKVLLHPPGRGFDNALERFRREGCVSSNLSHPHIVICHDLSLDRALNIYFLVLEYLDGESLSQRLKREGPFGSKDALHILKQIAAALDEIHAQGIIHRDLKLSNIMLIDRDGSKNFVKIIDLGFAKFMSQIPDVLKVKNGSLERGSLLFQNLTPAFPLTREGVIIGSPITISPEQIRGEVLDHRADIYALTIISYQLFSGKAPFVGRTAVETLRQHCECSPPKINDLLSSLHFPPATEDCLFAGLSKFREGRPSKASAFTLGLQRSLFPDDAKTVILYTRPAALGLRIGMAPLREHLLETDRIKKSKMFRWVALWKAYSLQWSLLISLFWIIVFLLYLRIYYNMNS